MAWQQDDVDMVYVANAKLSGDWSAHRFVAQIHPRALRQLTSAFPTLDPAVKLRLLMACMSINEQQLEECREELDQLGAIAKEDEDEWVKMMAHAVGDFSGQLNMEAVMESNPVVHKTLSSLKETLSQPGASGSCFPPREYLYFTAADAHPDQVDKAESPHFCLREEANQKLDTTAVPLSACGGQAFHTTPKGAGGGSASVHARRGATVSSLADSSMFRSVKLDMSSTSTTRSSSFTRHSSLTERMSAGRPSKARAIDITEAAGLMLKSQESAGLGKKDSGSLVPVQRVESGELPIVIPGGPGTATVRTGKRQAGGVGHAVGLATDPFSQPSVQLATAELLEVPSEALEEGQTLFHNTASEVVDGAGGSVELEEGEMPPPKVPRVESQQGGEG